MRAVILADGAVPSRRALTTAWPDWDVGIGLVIAADGGARHASAFELRIDQWVGDGDSIDPATLDALESAGVVMHRFPPDKDKSDTELAVDLAIEFAAEEVVILGGLGGTRIDHTIANIALLAHPALDGQRAWLFDEACTRISLITAATDGPSAALRALTGPTARSYEGRPGDVVTLLPFGADAGVVTTDGLRYPLSNSTLGLGRTRGLSNVRTAETSTVALMTGRLLVIETPVTVGS